MDEIAAAMAKLSGVRRALDAVLNEDVRRNRSVGVPTPRMTFNSSLVEHYFVQADSQVQTLRLVLPDLYGDFQELPVDPALEMSAASENTERLMHYSRAQVERLMRDIDQVFELRANSELEHPKQAAVSPRRVFITHGRSNDWRVVQAFVEKDVGINTLELAQEPNHGRTLIEKLLGEAEKCDGAVIVMTGDDVAADGGVRARENVMHEIGFFQGRYGRDRVVLLHEEGVGMPTNLGGLAYVPFAQRNIEGCFHVLHRELRAMYR